MAESGARQFVTDRERQRDGADIRAGLHKWRCLGCVFAVDELVLQFVSEANRDHPEGRIV